MLGRSQQEAMVHGLLEVLEQTFNRGRVYACWLEHELDELVDDEGNVMTSY